MLITATEIIKKSWETYSQNWKKFLPYIVLLFVSYACLTAVGVGGLWIEQLITDKNLIFTNNLVVAALDVIALLFILWTTLALLKNLRNAIENKTFINIKESYFQTSKYLWPVVWLSAVVFLTVVVGFFLLFIPALIFAIWFSYVVYIIVFEDKKNLNILKESKALVSGRWWKTLWLLVVPSLFFGIIILTLQMVVNLPFDIFLDAKSSSYVLITSILSTAISSLFAPLSALTTLYLYLSAKENPVVQSLPPTEIK